MNMLIATALACCFAMGGWFQPASQNAGGEKYIPYRAKVLAHLECGKTSASQSKPADHLDVNLLRAVCWRDYVDFTVTPHLDSDWRKCSVEFSTTNAGCGLIVTTNRVFTAPEAGYVSRVKVPMEVFTSDTFTLYLRTRTPTLHVMVAPPREGRVWTFEDGQPRFRFDLPWVDINLFGTRCLEPDLDLLDPAVVDDLGAATFCKTQQYLDYEACVRAIPEVRKHNEMKREKERLAFERSQLKMKLGNLEMVSRREGKKFPEEAEFKKALAALEQQASQLDADLVREMSGQEIQWRKPRETHAWFKSSPVVTRCIRVTDEDGQPLKGAEVSLRWYECQQRPTRLLDRVRRRVERATLKTDNAGLCRMKQNLDTQDELCVERVSLAGYCFENAGTGVLPPSYLHLGTDEQPYPLMMRKRAEETDMPLRLSLGRTFEVTRAEAQAKAKSFEVNLFSNDERTLGPDYVDFTLTPCYDAAREKWSVRLSTTNAGCGILATTNRTFIAPEKGYQPCIEVSQEEFNTPGFVLYLQTREPCVYAMVERCKQIPLAQRTTWTDRAELPLSEARVNLWGGRVFEADPAFDECGDLFTLDPRPLLEEHRYPQRPYLPPILDLMREKKALFAPAEAEEAEERRLTRQIAVILQAARVRGTYSAELSQLETRREHLRVQRELRRQRGIWLSDLLWKFEHPEPKAWTEAEYQAMLDLPVSTQTVSRVPSQELLDDLSRVQVNPKRSVQYLLVVDESGAPLAGADISLVWQVVNPKDGSSRPMSTHFRTGPEGRIVWVDQGPHVKGLRVETVELAGYAFEKSLNPDLAIPSLDDLRGSDQTPVRLVMRKIATQP